MVLSRPRASAPTRLRLPPSQASSFVRETDPRLLNKHHHYYYKSVMRMLPRPVRRTMTRQLTQQIFFFDQLLQQHDDFETSVLDSWRLADFCKPVRNTVDCPSLLSWENQIKMLISNIVNVWAKNTSSASDANAICTQINSISQYFQISLNLWMIGLVLLYSIVFLSLKGEPEH